MSSDSQKVTRGAAAYFVRYALVTGLGMGSNLLLLKLLEPREFGVLALLNLAIALLAVLTEGGLNVYLVQRAKQLEYHALSRTLAFQMATYLVVHLLLTLFVAWFAFGGRENALSVYLWCIAFAAPLSILRGGCYVVLEKRIDLTKIAGIETIEAVVYSCSLVGFALLGLGVWSMVLAALLRAAAGCGMAWWVVRPQFTFIRPAWDGEISAGLRFGINYHTSALLGIARSFANPILIGAILGLAAVGYCDRSAFLAGLPLVVVGTVQNRVLFPYFSKIQGDVTKACGLFTRSLFLSGVLDKVFFVVLFLLAPAVPTLLGEQWAPAVPVIQVMILGNMLFGSFASSAVPFLNALGKPHWGARLAIVYTAILWLLCWPFVSQFGLLGFAYLSCINWLPLVVLAFFMARAWPGLRFVSAWIVPCIAGVAGIVVPPAVLPPATPEIMSCLASASLGLATYLLCLCALGFRGLRCEFQSLRKNFLNQASPAHV